MHTAETFHPAGIDDCIARMQALRILVVGDLILDEFVWGQVTRISPEAPVPVVHVSRESAYPGGAANVARNLADFGVRAVVGGRIGCDPAAERLIACLDCGHISNAGIVREADYPTTIKTRVIARQQQVVRVDRETIRPLAEPARRDLLDQYRRLLPDVDAVIVEDYGKGLLDATLAAELVAAARDAGRLVAVDPSPANPLDWSGATLIKPNRAEAFAYAGLPPCAGDEALLAVGEKLLERWATPYLLITLGEEGMILFHPPDAPHRTPARAREVYDVSGAGDTSIAFFTAALAAGLAPGVALEIANHAAGIVVGKLGTATLSADELRESLLHNHG